MRNEPLRQVHRYPWPTNGRHALVPSVSGVRKCKRATSLLARYAPSFGSSKLSKVATSGPTVCGRKYRLHIDLMRNIPNFIGVPAAYNHASYGVGRSAMVGLLKYVCMTSRVGLLIASCSLGVCADLHQPSRSVRLPVVDGSDIRFTQLHPVQ